MTTSLSLLLLVDHTVNPLIFATLLFGEIRVIAQKRQNKMDAKLKFPKSTSFQLSLKLCWMKIALLVFEILEFEVGS